MAGYLSHIGSHFDWFLDHVMMRGYGPDDNAMWMSSLDLHTGRHPTSWERPEGIEKRCYRWIESPGGSNLYWDLPLVVATHALSVQSGDRTYAEAADAYVRDFLDRSVAPNGLFLWGNHYSYHATEGSVVFFPGGDPPNPVDPATQDGAYHETRPLPVAWDLFWRLDREGPRNGSRKETMPFPTTPMRGSTEGRRVAQRRTESRLCTALKSGDLS